MDRFNIAPPTIQTRERDTEPENDTADVHSAPLQVSNNCLVVLLGPRLVLIVSHPINILLWVGGGTATTTTTIALLLLDKLPPICDNGARNGI